MKSINVIIVSVCISVISCRTIKNNNLISNNSKNDLSFWYQKDNVLDSVPGISLNKFYRSKTEVNKNKKIIVAVIDSQIDLNHEDLKEAFWINKNEIPNNNIDDDKNEYIDDINGWSYIGDKKGGYVVWANYEYVRFIRKWKSTFDGKEEKEITKKDLNNFYEYQRAIEMVAYKKNYFEFFIKSIKHDIAVYPISKDTLKRFFPKENYTYNQLDSLYKKIKINNRTYIEMRDNNDRDVPALVYYMMSNLKSNYKTLESIKDRETQMDSIINKSLNIDFDERKFIGDNPDVLENGYGNNKLSSNIKGYRTIQDHATKVSGIIAAKRQNSIGIKGFSDCIKIMPLNISCSGDENDKDIALAIRYAVDKGAKIINMSFGKEFSVHKEWVSEALRYAENHNVLIVHAAGNNGDDIDNYPYYPNDNEYNGLSDVCENFINVGSTSNRLDNTLVSSFSSYGKQNVDLFAPGEKIYTTSSENKYVYDSGTSLAAPMVSGTAALIWLYYPKLTAAQVKQIILDSGTPYDIEVLIPGGQGKKAKFSELSKSGKVLNVYNAMKMAEAISKKNKN